MLIDQVVIAQDIRNRAYRLWEEAGRPENRSDEFWFNAKEQLYQEYIDKLRQEENNNNWYNTWTCLTQTPFI